MAEEVPGLSLSVGFVTPVAHAPGQGPVIRNRHSSHKLVTEPSTGEKNLYDNFMHGVRARPTAPCLGSRVRDDGTVGAYEWQTYSEVSGRVDSFTAGLWKLDLVPMSAEDGNRFLGFFLKNCRDWMVGALACYKTAVAVVPMYDTLGPETVSYIQEQTTTATVICSAPELKKLIAECPFANVIVTGAVAPELLQQAKRCAFKVYTFGEVESLGKRNLAVLAALPSPLPADLAVLCYTSGTYTYLLTYILTYLLTY